MALEHDRLCAVVQIEHPQRESASRCNFAYGRDAEPRGFRSQLRFSNESMEPNESTVSTVSIESIESIQSIQSI